MVKIFSESAYQDMIQKLFCRFPSFQKVGAGAYKPGIANMDFADQLMGRPHTKYDIIHVAGTNGKGSVSNMIASALAASGLKVGLYTSPHILDFRERIRLLFPCHLELPFCHPERIEGPSPLLIPKEDVWTFVNRWHETFDHLDLSFFEITTLMALDWFALQEADIVVLETGLGGRLDSTNIVTPLLSVITNIGLDHCDMLGETLPEIAFEKAGIIKPKVPVVVGESHPETDPVFERKVLYTNMSEPEYMGSRTAVMSLLTFADKVEPKLWDRHEEILSEMDLKGEYQRKNLRTVLAALDVLESRYLWTVGGIPEAIVHTAELTGFRGRWERISEDPYIICDIGHNEHGLRYNFAQLERMKAEGKCSDLIVVYGSVADKDVDSVIYLMPHDAVYVFTQASSRRALPAETIKDKYLAHCASEGLSPSAAYCVPSVREAVATAMTLAARCRETDPAACPLIYIGGSTYVVSEAVAVF